jgi:hypothetical protein
MKWCMEEEGEVMFRDGEGGGGGQGMELRHLAL